MSIQILSPIEYNCDFMQRAKKKFKESGLVSARLSPKELEEIEKLVREEVDQREREIRKELENKEAAYRKELADKEVSYRKELKDKEKELRLLLDATLAIYERNREQDKNEVRKLREEIERLRQELNLRSAQPQVQAPVTKRKD